MKVAPLNIKKSLNKAYSKQSIKRTDIEFLKQGLIKLFSRFNENESEEHLKNLLSDFLKETWYSGRYEINTSGRIDLAIHNGKTSKDTIGVIIEVKKPQSPERITKDNINCKALHELILYYFDQRSESKNIEIKHLVSTNIHEWFIFDENEFDKLFYRNTQLQKLYKSKNEQNKDNPFFYTEAQKIIAEIDEEINCTWLNIKDYEKTVTNSNSEDDSSLIELYKILSPEHLLKLSFQNDSNSLNKEFYSELLHIIGLEEVKEGSKKIISRKKQENRDDGSLLENSINILRIEGSIYNMPNGQQYGDTEEERLFSVGLELCINWLNRILFLKLLEGQLISYHKDNKDFSFLNSKIIRDFDELNELFFEVLAVRTNERTHSVNEKFGNIPYLNSSLFERSELENHTIRINSLKDRLEIPVYKTTVIKDNSGTRITGKKNTLQYLFEFLDAYDFASDSSAKIQEQNKSIINASVLGLIFEKINGYKDGSFFTPGFITMYMCRETLRRSVIQKFNEHFKWNIEEFNDLKDKIDGTDKTIRNQANDIINSLKICDPAVGSGHFLVSALNEMIAIKSELGILQYRDCSRVKGYRLTIENDELIIIDEETDQLFEYRLNQNSKPITELQTIQETLFHEKQTIIENCLFGVDINPKSVMICRLRLWIELLKNAYYTKESNFTELETLPNIDINIKCGNSLISRFALDSDLKQALKKSKWNIDTYRIAVQTYRNAKSKAEKREMEKLIESIKTDFESEIARNDKRLLKLAKLKGDLTTLTTQTSLFERTKKEQDEWNKKVTMVTTEIQILETELEEIKNNIIYRNAFEWRFEFPEVLNEEGDFVGFDVVIGNPPYFGISSDKTLKILSVYFKTFESTGDVYCIFYEQGSKILKEKGILHFITSNKWLRANYANKLRNFFINDLNPLLLFDFSWYQVFENASVDTNLLMFSKEKNLNKFQCGNAKTDFKIESLDEYLKNNLIHLNFNNNEFWAIVNESKSNLNNTLISKGKILSNWDFQIYRGILTGLNEAFIIDTSTKDKLIQLDSKNSDIIKPLLRGRDIERYGLNFNNLWLINSHNGLKEKKIKPINVEKDYPFIFEYLLHYKEKAEQRADKGDNWFNLRNCAFLDIIEAEKLIWAETMRIHKTGDRNFPRFGFDNGTYYPDKTVFIGLGEHLKYLLAFLNSKVGRYLIMQYVDKLDTGGYMMQKAFLDKIPVYYPNEIEEQPIIDLINQILEQKNQNPKSDTSKLEESIDKLIYKFYKLSEDEIKIIEQS